MSARTRTIWTFIVTSVALFMAQLDNLVVTTALPVIRQNLHASLLTGVDGERLYADLRGTAARLRLTR
jgi:hypothetical protein